MLDAETIAKLHDLRCRSLRAHTHNDQPEDLCDACFAICDLRESLVNASPALIHAAEWLPKVVAMVRRVSDSSADRDQQYAAQAILAELDAEPPR